MSNGLEIVKGDNNEAKQSYWSLSEVVSVIEAPITPPILPSFNTSILSIPIVLLYFILSLLKYYILLALQRIKWGFDLYVIKLQDLIGNSETLDRLFGYEEVQRIIKEAPKKQLELQIKINSVTDDQREIKHRCKELEKRLERLATKQAKYQAFLANQAALKKAQESGKEIEKIE